MRINMLAAALAVAGLAFGATTVAAEPSSGTTAAGTYGTATSNWFGGPIYNGQPALEATAALVKAGGGAQHFSFAKALVSMLGEKTVNAEVAKLTKQYGKTNVDNFIGGMDFAVTDGLKRATEQGVKLPAAPADLHGAKLATTLVQAGTAPDGAFWSGYLFDKTLSHPIHVAVMADIDNKSGHAADENTHKILNQAMYDVAQALGHKDVKLASLH
ncbi:MAG: hypothetical protein ABIY40_03625 [Rhodanobacteraceae bacterium]